MDRAPGGLCRGHALADAMPAPASGVAGRIYETFPVVSATAAQPSAPATGLLQCAPPTRTVRGAVAECNASLTAAGLPVPVVVGVDGGRRVSCGYAAACCPSGDKGGGGTVPPSSGLASMTGMGQPPPPPPPAGGAARGRPLPGVICNGLLCALPHAPRRVPSHKGTGLCRRFDDLHSHFPILDLPSDIMRTWTRYAQFVGEPFLLKGFELDNQIGASRDWHSSEGQGKVLGEPIQTGQPRRSVRPTSGTHS